MITSAREMLAWPCGSGLFNGGSPIVLVGITLTSLWEQMNKWQSQYLNMRSRSLDDSFLTNTNGFGIICPSQTLVTALTRGCRIGILKLVLLVGSYVFPRSSTVVDTFPSLGIGHNFMNGC